MRNDFENECKVQYIEFNNVFMDEIPNYYTRATMSANKEKLIFYTAENYKGKFANFSLHL